MMNAFHCFIIIIEGLWLRFIRSEPFISEPFISIRDLSIRDESDVTTFRCACVVGAGGAISLNCCSMILLLDNNDK